MNKTFALGAIGAVALSIALSLTIRLQPEPEARCPAGMMLTDPVTYAREFQPHLDEAGVRALRERFGDQACLARKHPEPFAEIQKAQQARSPGVGQVAPGAFRAAVDRKRAMLERKAVANADSEWEEYGVGVLITNDNRYGTAGQGIPSSMGRVDSFAYDPEANRLFALVGTGGLWMSEADTVTALGDFWVPIGDTLPTLSNGAVEWIAAKGERPGRLVVVSGEHLMGGTTYTGLGAFWSDDLGQTWQQSTGVPDGALGFEVAVDPTNTDEVYVATSQGLFKSFDAGETFTNVNLPVSDDCAGVTGYGACQFANFVTDVVIKQPGGITDEAGGEVLAAVGYRAGKAVFPDGTVHSPGNGLYRSDSGDPDSFVRLDVSGDGLTNIGFTTEERIGRTELGIATGPDQDHNVVYAIVGDAVLFNGGVQGIDIPDDGTGSTGVGLNSTSVNGVYVSTDFGDSWLRLADDIEIALNPASGSSLSVVGAVLLNGPGVQAWYNMWVAPDPTRADPISGYPTRLTFGLEEVWQSRTTSLIAQDGVAQIGPNDYNVIGSYYAGTSCQLLDTGVPLCPTNTNPINADTTTHPDQHDGLWIPTGDGGVCLFAGNDGGVFRQCVAAGGELDNFGWGQGANDGFYSLLPYGVAVAKDGRAYFGLQDNGSGHVEGDTRLMYQSLGGDGFYAAVDPDDSDYAYLTTQNGGLNLTLDGGLSYSSASSGAANVSFANYFTMNELNAEHVMTGGSNIVETLQGRTTGNWTEVFDLGTSETGGLRQMSTIHLRGDAAYVGFCGVCDVLNRWDQGFANGIATNVAGDLPPNPGTSDGWHIATAAGLPNRYITSIEQDPADASTIYVTLGGYSGRDWVPPGSYLDTNADLGQGNVFKSTDAGESFVDISGNLPALQVNTVLQRGTQLIIGTDIGAFISSDLDGTEWDVLGGTSLPNVVVTQIVQDPGNDDRIFAATFGRHIWTYRFDDDVVIVDGPDSGPTGKGGAWGAGVLVLLALAAVGRRRRRYSPL